MALAGAYTILTSTAFLHAGLMNSRKEGRYTNLRGRRAPEDLSILSSILGISQEVCPYLISPPGLFAEALCSRLPTGRKFGRFTSRVCCTICLMFRDPYLPRNQRQTASRSSTFRISIPRKADPIWTYQTIRDQRGTDTRAMRMTKMRVGIECDRRDRPLQSDASLKHTRNT